MKCPRCNVEMTSAELEKMFENEIWESWQCPACGYSTEIKKERPKPS